MGAKHDRLFCDWCNPDDKIVECKANSGRRALIITFETILFDLDGTLTDSKEGIINSYLNALNKMGLVENDIISICDFIGKPLHKYFEEIHKLAGVELEKAVNLYREYYSAKGIYENKLYDGIPNLLERLLYQNKQLFVVTGKPLVYLKEILRYFNLDGYFKNLYGSGSGIINSSKEELIYEMRKQVQPDINSTVMIGDTKFDIIGAKENGIKSIAVTYGYGTEKELRDSKPDYIVESVIELKRLLGPI